MMKDKKVAVIGLGSSGLNAALLLKDIGADVKITEASDNENVRKNAMLLEERKIPCQIGGHTKDFIEGNELIVVSPGVEDSSPSIKWANELGIPMISEMELGYSFCKGRIMAITGTNGKSTVTTLIGQILEKSGLDTVVCGNIGNSLCGEIKRINKDTWVVLEVSSFQLERISNFKPHIAIILNITDDHLDRYSKFSDYFNEKLKVFKNQDVKDILILNRDAKELEGLDKKAKSKVLYYSRLTKTNGTYLKDNKIICAIDGRNEDICATEDIRLKGLHNAENVLVSSLAGIIAGVKAVSIKNTIRNFNSLRHRFETVDIIGGVEYIDDSKGTTVDSTYRALESCERPVILIAGGKDKNSNYGVIRELVKKKVKYLILIGEARKRIKKALGDAARTHEAGTMQEAVELARRLAKENTLVLLSPMCSSFDMFKDYKERGEIFKKAVLSIK
ncbi:MAG: UDP-N-acetylmuramoylalanine--D-glutamate ligase [Omnitrophica bacterium RIFCSPLOWO2_01_FULL_45_24]|nr:MAG: UDP-N-acetylmuramoylalanine--D-glutamate ligase [Omnitrophica bacterium RIFCSPLOWO2_12_FULL_45_13]OGW94425.1 MAG: UDP-N-acetylmuramoylalanine--D-glutamate ligase [Omnitrophica bacterium RIFCSPLOWO2_01_FULL_45_24]